MSIIYTFRDGSNTSTIGIDSYSKLFSDNSYNEVDTIFIETDCVLPAYGTFLGRKEGVLDYLNTGTLFSKCINLKSITVGAGNLYYSSDERDVYFH